MTPIERIANTLAEEFGEAPQFYAERAESLDAVREHFGVPIDACLFWIRDKVPGKEHSLVEFRAWCEKWADTAEKTDFHVPALFLVGAWTARKRAPVVPAMRRGASVRQRRNRRWAAAVYALQLRDCGYSPREAAELVATQFRTRPCPTDGACARMPARQDTAGFAPCPAATRTGG
jgi:hypothetical protein